MPRDHARLSVGIWDDKDFQQLDPALQGTYWALCAHPTMSWCGVLDWVPQRLVKFSAAMTSRKLSDHLARLAEPRFLCLDDDTAEILIRSFVRHDGVMKMPNVAKAMATALGRVQSEYLRGVVVAELARHLGEEPDLKGWKALREGFPDLMDEVSEKGWGNP